MHWNVKRRSGFGCDTALMVAVVFELAQVKEAAISGHEPSRHQGLLSLVHDSPDDSDDARRNPTA
jgi:hypothetical protein